MHTYLIIPIVSTICGFAAGLLVRSVVIRRLPGIMQSRLPAMAAKLFTPDRLASALAGKTSFDTIRPLVDQHIDDFLRHKLAKEMPMIGMFIGDKTISQLKGIFIKELEEIFPQVMDQYVRTNVGELNPGRHLGTTLSSIPADKYQTALRPFLQYLPSFGALTGLLTGFLQIAVLWTVS